MNKTSRETNLAGAIQHVRMAIDQVLQRDRGKTYSVGFYSWPKHGAVIGFRVTEVSISASDGTRGESWMAADEPHGVAVCALFERAVIEQFVNYESGAHSSAEFEEAMRKLLSAMSEDHRAMSEDHDPDLLQRLSEGISTPVQSVEQTPMIQRGPQRVRKEKFVLLDTSGSMSVEGRWEKARAALKHFFPLPEGTNLTLVLVGSSGTQPITMDAIGDMTVDKVRFGGQPQFDKLLANFGPDLDVTFISDGEHPRDVIPQHWKVVNVDETPIEDERLLDLIRRRITPDLVGTSVGDANNALAMVLEDFLEMYLEGERTDDSRPVIDRFLGLDQDEDENPQTKDFDVILTRALDSLPSVDLMPGVVSWHDIAESLEATMLASGWAFVGITGDPDGEDENEALSEWRDCVARGETLQGFDDWFDPANHERPGQ